MTPELTLMNTNEADIMDTLKKKRNSAEGSDGKKKAKRATEAVADEAEEEEVPEAEADEEDPGVTAEEDQGTEKAKETTTSLLVGHPEKTVTPAQEAKETTAPRRVGRPKKTVTPAQEDDPETEEAKEITALRAKNKLDERRTNPKSTSGKRGAVSYEDMFKNTKILTHNTDTEGNMVRVEGIAEFNRETKSFNVFWETEDEPPLLKLSKQDMDVLVTNSKQLDLTGLIESCIGYTVVTKHSFWLHELPICITDKHNVPIIIQYDTRPISTEYIKLGDSLMINVDIDPDMLTETLQLELVAYDVESVYIKYVTWFIENSNLKMEMEMSFTKMNRVEYGELDVGRLNLGTFDEHNWPMWYKKYHVCDKYSTEFLEYVRLCEK